MRTAPGPQPIVVILARSTCAGCQQHYGQIRFAQIDVGLDNTDPVVVGRGVDSGCQSGRRVALMRTAVCLALSTLVACAVLGKEPSRPDLKPWPEIRPDFRVETLRMRMHEYSITFAADVDLAATRSSDKLPIPPSGATPYCGGPAPYRRCEKRAFGWRRSVLSSTRGSSHAR